MLLGTLIAVLPGIGATATIAMLLPITFQIGYPVSSLIMLAGIYYGAQYGGSTTAILINMPGESSSAVTAIDATQMARNGRAGVALATACHRIPSSPATIATRADRAVCAALTTIALKFGAAEYCSLMWRPDHVGGAGGTARWSRRSPWSSSAFSSACRPGMSSRARRGSIRAHPLGDQLNFVAIAVGLFGIAEILRNLEDERTREVLNGQGHRADADRARISSA